MSDARRDGRGAEPGAAAGSRVDLAIDRAVREMLDVEAPMDLRAKVLARIDGRAGSRARRPAAGFQLPALSLQRFAAVSAVAALVVLVLVLVRRAEPPAQAPVVARAGSQRPGPSVPNTPPRTERIRPSDVPEVPAPAHVARETRAAVVAAATTTAGEQTTAIEPLNTITPINVAPIAQGSIAPAPIAVRPLAPITEMQIAPLNPPDGRN